MQGPPGARTEGGRYRAESRGQRAKGRGQREEMADTHEEQLLSELLSSIARDDERLEAGHLESRVMATLDTSPTPWLRPHMTHVVIAAAAVMAVLVPGIAWVVREVPPALGEMRVEP